MYGMKVEKLLEEGNYNESLNGEGVREVVAIIEEYDGVEFGFAIEGEDDNTRVVHAGIVLERSHENSQGLMPDITGRSLITSFSFRYLNINNQSSERIAIGSLLLLLSSEAKRFKKGRVIDLESQILDLLYHFPIKELVELVKRYCKKSVN